MNKNKNENKLIPELRFPEFVKDEGWKEENLGTICDYFNGASHEGGVNEEGNFYLISLNSIDIEGNLKKDMKRLSYTDNSLKKNDIVMVLSDVAHGNFLGLTDIIPNNNFVLNQRMAGLRIKNTNDFVPFYIKTYINNNQKYFKNKGQGSSQLNLSKASVTDFSIFFPVNPSEQEKIASCLSSLDELLAAHTDKLETLKTHKKGLMQNLFPQEGEKMPKFRFKEFEKDGDWEMPRLEDKMDIFRGASPRPQGDPKYYGGKVPRLMIEDVTRDGKYSTPKIDSLTEEGALKSRFLKKGSVVLSCSGTRVAIPGILAVDACIHDGWLGFKNLKEVETEFLYYHFCNLHEKIQGDALAGGVFNNLTTTILKEIKLGFPRRKEQNKIADTLSSLDNLIKEQADKIEQLKLHKKGLMQGLFPKVKN